MISNIEVGYIVIITMALCQALKYAGVKGRWIPLIGVVIAIVLSFIFGGVDGLGVSAGVLLGLGTSGLYDLVKKTILNK